MVRTEDPIHDPSWTVEEVGLEDLVLAYMGQAATTTRQSPSQFPSSPTIGLVK